MAVEGILLLSKRFQWFAFNEKKSWTVLIAVASVGLFLLLMHLCSALALHVRWRFQFYQVVAFAYDCPPISNNQGHFFAG
jgi:hypothetical protein